ncbi:MAG: imelysin family protein [Panacagrimonas sp.]
MRKLQLVAGLLVGLGLSGCGGGDGLGDGSNEAEVLAEVASTHADIAFAAYSDTVADAQALDAALDALVQAPSEARLTAARQAWLDARPRYLQTETFRFYDGPIDNPSDGPEGLINAWPLDEFYIDYVQGDALAGIVNDPIQPITAESLEMLNEAGGEKNIATGYHAIEFLLWGQDLDEDGPGARPFTDYLAAGRANADRRGLYLTTASELLIARLQQVAAQWNPDSLSSNFRGDFLADPREALRSALIGMYFLAVFETGGERLRPALELGQEEEHSCFSDNTNVDHLQDIRGIQNLYEGRYPRRDGTTLTGSGVREAVELKSEAMADTLGDAIDAAVAAATALQPTFDQEIVTPDGRARVNVLIDALEAVGDAMEPVFEAYGFTTPTGG